MRVGVVWTFLLSSIISLSFLSLSLWETARYRLKYCLEGPLSPKQPTNQLSPLWFEPCSGHRGGRVVRWCWVNFQCHGVLLILIVVGQGPITLAIGAGVGCLDIFSLVYHFSFLSPSLWETARCRLKYCLKGPLSPEPTNARDTCMMPSSATVGQVVFLL